MNKLLEQYFVKKYSKIFKEMYGPMNKTCMHWGIECDDGWFFLLDNLCNGIQSHIDHRQESIDKGFAQPEEKPIPQVVAKQIKEKYAALRFYYNGGDDYIRSIVQFTENISLKTCELCGVMNEEVGQTVKCGWIQTLCIKCAKKNKKTTYQQKDMIALWKKVKSKK